MGEMTFILGGARSGKTSFAQNLAETLKGPKIYLATCLPFDDELIKRVLKHKNERDPGLWETIEEPMDFSPYLKNCGKQAIILLDCLTLWINNLLYKYPKLSEEDIAEKIKKIFSSTQNFKHLIVVSNEVGLGLVPIEKDSRTYRDILGKANQVLAKMSKRVIFISCGLPLYLKGNQLGEME
jgi:adenosylcobinamide kinase/adenosylcobinamide-phosphate guanylyltransferase